MPKMEDLKKEVEVLKLKLQPQVTQTKSVVQIRRLRKRLKRAQRKIRFLTGKRLASKKKESSAKESEK